MSDTDCVFLHDSTGSQQPYINAARDQVMATVQKIHDVLGSRARFRVVAFRDHQEQGDDWTVHSSNPFTTDAGQLRRQLDELVADGGGDGPEAQIDGLYAALNSDWRGGAKRIVTIVTDSPPHGIGEPRDTVPESHPGYMTPDGIIREFVERRVRLNVIGCYPEMGYYSSRTSDWYQNFARVTTGKFFKLETTASVSVHHSLVGTVLHAGDLHAIADGWDSWITARAGSGSLVDDLHGELRSRGTQCHDVYYAGKDVQYSKRDITRESVDSVVANALKGMDGGAQLNEVKGDDLVDAFLG